MDENFLKHQNVNMEGKQDSEVQTEFLKLDQRANEIGEKFENINPIELTENDVLSLNQEMNMILSTLLIIGGATGAYLSGVDMQHVPVSNGLMT